MRKLGLLLWMLAFTAVGAQAQNIIKSLERTVPGQGKVTIHQDPKIEAHQRVFPRTDDLHFVQSSPLALSCG